MKNSIRSFVTVYERVTDFSHCDVSHSVKAKCQGKHLKPCSVLEKGTETGREGCRTCRASRRDIEEQPRSLDCGPAGTIARVLWDYRCLILGNSLNEDQQEILARAYDNRPKCPPTLCLNVI